MPVSLVMSVVRWFGNLTTMQWWDNVRLNEGFATLIGTMAVDHLFPEWVVWTQFVKDDWAGALSLDGKFPRTD